MMGVADPGLDAGVDVRQAEATFGIGASETTQTSPKAQAVVIAEPPPVREDQIAQQVETVTGTADLSFVRVQAQPFLIQIVSQRGLMVVQTGFAVGQQHHVIDITQIGVNPALFLEPVVEVVEPQRACLYPGDRRRNRR